MIQLTSKITVQEIQQMGSDAMIAAAAWVSTSAYAGLQKSKQPESDVPRLLNYLVKHRHGTPFEHGALTVYIHAPIFVWREWHRHRIGFSYNEESARYHQLEPVFYVAPSSRPSLKVEDWRPGMPKFLEDSATVQQVNESNVEVYELAYKNYCKNLEAGADPGFARDCLPVGIYSSCWVTCNPRSIMAFLSLRIHDPSSSFLSYPLYEIQQAAKQLEAIFEQHWPLTHEAFVANGRVSP